jgi:hypothetical protein
MNDIERVAAMIQADQSNIGRISCGEVIAAALLFDRLDWLPILYKHPVDAIDRLGDKWLQMVLEYRRAHPD